MTAQFLSPGPSIDDPLLTAVDPLAAARTHLATNALIDTPVGPVGLELEFHLVDLARPGHRPAWDEVQALATGLPPMPAGSRVTVEPGGQVELSTPPVVGVAGAIAALQSDEAVLREAALAAGYGTAALGADPARPARRVNPQARYVAMERHFAAVGCREPGLAMMAATAALQVNLDAGPRAGWADRMRRIHDLGPTLVALSACSPYLGGHASGWRSMRQQAWLGIDAGRSAAVPAAADPAEAWAEYALAAPVMLVRDGDSARPLTRRVPFTAWLAGTAPIERRPTLGDLEYHLTTLFPPVRPRGWIEIRCLDAQPSRWWPALAAITTVLVDDPVAADRAAELCDPVRGAWTLAAREGLGDADLRAAATGCAEVVAERCPPAVKADVEAYAALVASGQTPGDEIRKRAELAGPLCMLEEQARAR